MKALSRVAALSAAILTASGLALAGGTAASADGSCETPGVVINGNAANNFIVGTPFADVINGGGGNDTILGGGGNDTINGGAGNDTISGQGCDDRLAGNDGDDKVNGNDGNDQVGGGNGRDDLSGDNGRDRVSGGNGNDTLTGGLPLFAPGDSGNGGPGFDACSGFEALAACP